VGSGKNRTTLAGDVSTDTIEQYIERTEHV